MQRTSHCECHNSLDGQIIPSHFPIPHGIEFLAHRNVVQYYAVHCPLMRRQVRPHECPTENPSVCHSHEMPIHTFAQSYCVLVHSIVHDAHDQHRFHPVDGHWSPDIPSVNGDVIDVVCSLRGSGMSVLFTLEYPLQCD